jgi:hypothetical protein
MCRPFVGYEDRPKLCLVHQCAKLFLKKIVTFLLIIAAGGCCEHGNEFSGSIIRGEDLK